MTKRTSRLNVTVENHTSALFIFHEEFGINISPSLSFRQKLQDPTWDRETAHLLGKQFRTSCVILSRKIFVEEDVLFSLPVFRGKKFERMDFNLVSLLI